MFIKVQNLKGFSGWCPQQVDVDGLSFMRISKRDHALGRVCNAAGDNKTIGKRVDVNVAFIDELQRLRTDACTVALKDVLMSCADNQEKEAAKLKRRRVKNADKHLCPAHIRVVCPSFTLKNGQELHSVPMKVLFGVGRNAVYVEINDINLEYIIARIEDDLATGRNGIVRVKRDGSALSSESES
jgi:hypothetical protein